MSLNELLALAKIVTEEYLVDKNSSARIGSLFTAVITFFSELKSKVIGTNGSIDFIIGVTQVEFDALEAAGTLDDKTFYIILDPDQQSSIEQILADLSTAIDLKADAQAIAQSLQDLSTLIASKASTQDLASFAAIVSTTTIEQNPDWRDVFTRNGSWVFVDDQQGICRPEGFALPDYDEQRLYNVISWAKAVNNKPTALVKDQTDGGIYILTMVDDITIIAQGLATTTQLGDIESALDAIILIAASI